jgi:lysozyme
VISDRGLTLISEFEGLSLSAYPDPATGGEPWTIGYGHTGGVKPGDTCTQEQALEWLRSDTSEAEACVDAHVVPELTQEQRDALISFVYNLGCLAFRGSTLLRLLNAGDVAGAAGQFKRWNRAGDHVMAGLTRRREAEAELFMQA